MRLIKPSFEIIEQKPGVDGLLQHIERCGRTCYKSEDKITEDSAEKFVNMLVNRGHTAMVEHGTVYLYIDDRYKEYEGLTSKYQENPYSHVNIFESFYDEIVGEISCNIGCITTNYRVLLQNDWLDDLKYQCEPTEHHVKRVTVKFVCDRGVSHEFVRHRVFSFAQESTRYCNYSKDKFGKECTFIIPSWLDLPEGSYSKGKVYTDLATPYLIKGTPEELLLLKLVGDELDYFDLLDKGWIAQQARAVLPNSLKTELIMTGTIEQWEGFFKLRDAKDAHPQARELAQPLHEEFIKRGYIK